MVTKTIFRKIKQLQEKLQKDLECIEREVVDPIDNAEKSLMLIDECTRTLKKMVSDKNFECLADEIYFFKEIKPLFISKFIYYSSVLDVESLKPDSSEKVQIKYYEIELEKLKKFYIEQSDFYSYYNRNATYLDQKYFVRNCFDLKMKLLPNLYNYDESFTTSHDHYVSQVLANKLLKDYFRRRILSISKGKEEEKDAFSTLVWSSSKVGLTELIYGLYNMRCFNGGNVELSEVMRFFEKSLAIDLGNYHKTIFEIRNRKNDTTKFLHLLNDSLRQHFIDTEMD
jgi:hypothetical protein